MSIELKGNWKKGFACDVHTLSSIYLGVDEWGEDIDERKRLLSESLEISETYDIEGKNILVIDDLYRSGATLTAATQLLYENGDVKDVFVLAMTKTRSKR